MKDPWFWGESFLQGGAAGIYGDFFKEAFSRSDTSLTETMMGPLAAIPAGIQGLTSGARRVAESGEKVKLRGQAGAADFAEHAGRQPLVHAPSRLEAAVRQHPAHD